MTLGLKYDYRSAGVALSHDAVLVTRNLKAFSRISDPRLENWYE